MSNNKKDMSYYTNEHHYLNEQGLALYDENLKAYIEKRIPEATASTHTHTVEQITGAEERLQELVEEKSITEEKVTTLISEAIDEIETVDEALFSNLRTDLSDQQKWTARGNIGAASNAEFLEVKNSNDTKPTADEVSEMIDQALAGGGLDDSSKFLKTTEQRLTTDEQTQARANIDAAANNHTHSASNITSGTLSIARGGTGKTSHTTNAVLTGNSSSAIKNVATKSGAFYATDTNGAPTFGILPIAQGGTGVSSLGTEGAILQAGPGGDSISSTKISSGAFYCPSNSTSPQFGILPITYGGTGAFTPKTARENLGLHMERVEIVISETASGGFYLLPGIASFCVACISGVALTSASLMNPALASNRVANITLFTSDYQLADELKTGVFIYQKEKEDTERHYFVDIFYILV
jgi:hypothetical protein